MTAQPAVIALHADDARALTDQIKVALAQLNTMPPRPRQPQDDTRQVYLILAWRSRMVKVGVSADPIGRLAGLQTMSPEPLELIGVTQRGGRRLEEKLHQSLDALHAHGEWFHLTSELIEILLEASA